MLKSSKEQIEHNFKYHTPDKDQLEKYNQIRTKAKKLAYLINDICPISRERSLAMTKLEETMMWANASIAREETITWDNTPKTREE